MSSITASAGRSPSITITSAQPSSASRTACACASWVASRRAIASSASSARPSSTRLWRRRRRSASRGTSSQTTSGRGSSRPICASDSPRAAGLRRCARITVDHEPLLVGQRRETLAHDSVDDLLGHQLAGGHDGPDPPRGLGLGLGLVAKDPAGADVHQAEMLGEASGLRPLARARRAEHDHLRR